MNKTAVSSFTNASFLIFFVVIAFATTLLIGIFLALIGSYEAGLIDVPGKFEAEVISLRFTNNPKCFAYQENDRVFVGVIDFEKFNNEQMESCYKTETKDEINFRLQLGSNLDNSVETNNYRNVDTFTIVKDVVVRDSGSFSGDKLFIYVQDGLIG
jgi:hypothetical protein